MPYIRSITLFFALLILILTVLLPLGHPFYTVESMLLAVIFALTVWLMSLARSFMMDLLAVLFTAFFSQRIVTIYFSPGSLDYQNYLSFTPENFTFALTFLSLSAFAALFGYLCAQIFIFPCRNSGTLKSPNIAPIKILGKKVPFDKFFLIYAYIAVFLIFLKLYLMIFSGVGVTGLSFERVFAVPYRISLFFAGLGFLPFLVILSPDKNPKIRKMAILLIVLIVLHALFRASKGVILALTLQYLICHYLVRGFIPKKYMQYAFMGFIVTIILSPLIMFFRAYVIQFILEGNIINAWGNVSFSEVFVFSGTSFGFLQRMGGFDWLLGLMNVGREAFPWWASLTGDLLMVLKTLWPGDALMFIRDYVPVETIIPELLRGWNMEHHLGHGEIMGGIGMAYIYWGPTLGIIFFFIWVLIIALFYRSNFHVIFKVLLLYYFLTNVFIGGGFISALCRIYESIIAIVICSFIYCIFRLKRPLVPEHFGHSFQSKSAT
jgi:hypothetical protein